MFLGDQAGLKEYLIGRIAGGPRTHRVRLVFLPDLSITGKSPSWHRNARGSRARARGWVHKLSWRTSLSATQLARCSSSLGLLCAHHTRPIYRVSNYLYGQLKKTRFPYLRSLMSGQWNSWQWKGHKKGQGQSQPKGPPKPKKEGPKENKAMAFPSYDGAASSTSSLASSSMVAT